VAKGFGLTSTAQITRICTQDGQRRQRQPDAQIESSLLAEPGEHWSQSVIQPSAQTIAADSG
jgi:hypothetical protein